jgi:hypothetical protein
MAVNQALSQLSKSWKNATPQQAGFGFVPDGDYVGDLKELKLGESKNKNMQIVVTYEIVDGDYTGKTLKQFHQLSNEQIGYFKGFCEVIGLDLPDDANAWQEAMDEFVAGNNDLYNLHVKTKEGSQYSNTYLNGISEYTKSQEGVEEEQVEEEQQAEEEQQEEEQQEVKAPIKKFSKPVAQAQKPVAKPVGQVATKVLPKRK